MQEKTKAKGFESAFCTQWSGWDLADAFIVQFYDADLSEQLRLKTGRSDIPCLSINLEETVVEGFDEEGETIFCVPFSMVIDE